ncbi:MAG: transketolase C-terminal domain-containing protein, partial [Thermodesulfobium sp.]
REIATREAYGRALVELGRQNNNVVVLDADLAKSTQTIRFAKEFPDRFFDVGIAEQFAATFAAGLSTQGLKPVVAIYSTFLQRAYDQLIHDVALQNLPITFVLDRAGLCGPDGPTHHGAFDLSFLLPIPNLHILVPSDEIDLQNMLNYSVKLNAPAVIRYPKGEIVGKRQSAPSNFDEPEFINRGNKIAILAIGPIVWKCIKIIEENNLTNEVSIVAFKKIKPWTEKTFETFEKILKSHTKIFTVEENSAIGGFGSYCLLMASRSGQAEKFSDILGFPDYFMPHGDNNSIMKQIKMSDDDILKTINRLLVDRT